MLVGAAGWSHTIADLPSQTGDDDTREWGNPSLVLHARVCEHAAKTGTGVGWLCKWCRWPPSRAWVPLRVLGCRVTDDGGPGAVKKNVARAGSFQKLSNHCNSPDKRDIEQEVRQPLWILPRRYSSPGLIDDGGCIWGRNGRGLGEQFRLFRPPANPLKAAIDHPFEPGRQKE